MPHDHAILPKLTETLEPLPVPAVPVQIAIQQPVVKPKIPAVDIKENADHRIVLFCNVEDKQNEISRQSRYPKDNSMYS